MRISKGVLKIMASLLGLAALMGALWWSLFGLKPYEIDARELQRRYAYGPPHDLALKLAPIDQARLSQDFSFSSFDGATVNGRIRYPADPATAGAPFPLLIAMHGMGRSHWRWWQAEYKGGKTREHTHQLTALALQRGHAVIAIDARRHGERKDPKVNVEQLMDELHIWGKREPYEAMLVDTVRDHRVLLDWVTRLPQIDPRRIKATGYSMGGQNALLLAGVDERIGAVAAIVPILLDDKLAAVAAKNLLPGLADNGVWLLTADQDEYTDSARSRGFFEALPGADKQHLRLAGGHLLPADYVARLGPWFDQR